MAGLFGGLFDLITMGNEYIRESSGSKLCHEYDA